MKPGLDVLPIEVWMSVFDYPWIGRELLAGIVGRFRERKFIRFLQYFLHRWGKQKLNEVAFDKNGMYKWIDRSKPYFDFPLTPLPENIKSFDCVAIDDSDGYAQGLAFLRIIKAILKDVNLTIYRAPPRPGAGKIPANTMENLRIVLGRLLPLLDKGIHSLRLYGNASALPTIGQHLGDRMAKLKVLKIYHIYGVDAAMLQATTEFILNWLNSPRDGNEPKLCEAYIDPEFGQQIIQAIRQQFKVATTPCTFALILPFWGDFPNFHREKGADGSCFLEWEKWGIAEFHENNGIDEELHGLKMNNGAFRILRHQSGRRPELQQWIEENEYHGQLVAVSIPINPIDAAKLDAAMDDEDKDKKPSTSKDA